MKVRSTMVKISVWGLIFLLSAMVFACRGQQTQSSEPAPAVVEEMDPPLGTSFKTIIVGGIKAATPELQAESKAMAECHEAVLSALKANPRFQVMDANNAGQSNPDGTLLLNMTLTSIRVVSKKARFWGGAMAGSSYMNVDLEFIDTASANTLRQKEISSQNNPFGAAYSSGRTDTTLATDVGHIIAAYVDAVIPK